MPPTSLAQDRSTHVVQVLVEGKVEFSLRQIACNSMKLSVHRIRPLSAHLGSVLHEETHQPKRPIPCFHSARVWDEFRVAWCCSDYWAKVTIDDNIVNNCDAKGRAADPSPPCFDLPTHFASTFVTSTAYEYLGNAKDYVEEIHNIFVNAPLFEKLDIAETQALCRFMAVYSAPTNTVLMHQDDAPDRMLILLTGGALAVRHEVDGSAVTLHSLKPGDSFGELAMLDGGPLRSTCSTTEPVDFVVLSRHAFRDVLITLPRLGNKLLMLFMHIVSQRLQEAELRLPARLCRHGTQPQPSHLRLYRRR